MFFSKILVHGFAVGAALQTDVPQQPVSQQLKAVVIGGDGVRTASMMRDMKPESSEDHRFDGYTSHLFGGSEELGDLMVYEVHSSKQMSSGPLADALQTANVIVFVCDIKKPASFKHVVELKDSLSRSTSSSHDPDFMLVMTGTPAESSHSYTSLFDVKPVQRLLSKDPRHRQFSFRLASSPAITDADIESVPNHTYMSAQVAYAYFYQVISHAAARHGFIAPNGHRDHFIRTPTLNPRHFILRVAEENYLRNPPRVQARASSVPASQPPKQPEHAEESRRQMQRSRSELMVQVLLEGIFETPLTLDDLRKQAKFRKDDREMIEFRRKEKLARQKRQEDDAEEMRKLKAEAAALQLRNNCFLGVGVGVFLMLFVAILLQPQTFYH